MGLSFLWSGYLEQLWFVEKKKNNGVNRFCTLGGAQGGRRKKKKS